MKKLTELCQIDKTWAWIVLVVSIRTRAHLKENGVQECDDAKETEYRRPNEVQYVCYRHKL